MKTNKAKIIAQSCYLPEKILSNKDLVEEFEKITEDDILRRTGIKNRRISAPDEIASDMAFKVGEFFFEEHPEHKKESIDLVVFCSEGFDYIAPASSCILHSRLNLPSNCASIDLPYGCSGYLYGLSMAKAYIESGMFKTVLFITADIPSKVIHKNDLELRSLFSDAATATLISNQFEIGTEISEFIFGTDGNGACNLLVERSGFRNPIDGDYLKQYSLPVGQMRMDSTEIFLFALKTVPKLVEDTLAKNDLTQDQIDLFILHQANGFMLETLRKKLKISQEKFYFYIEDVGNTVSSTIPLAMMDAKQNGKIKPNMNILIAGFGIGNSWSATILKT